MKGEVGVWRKKIMCGYDGTFNDWLLEQRDEAFDNFYTVRDLAEEVGAPVRCLYSALSRAGIRWPYGPNRTLYKQRTVTTRPKWAIAAMNERGFDHVRDYLNDLAKEAKRKSLSLKEVAERHDLSPEGLDYHLHKWEVEWPTMYHSRGRMKGLRMAGKRQKGRARKMIEYKGEQVSYTELCKRHGMNPNTVRYRIRPFALGGAGMTLEEALTTPLNERKVLPPALRKRNAELKARAHATS